MKKKKYVSVQEVANYLEVSRQSVHKWINKGKIPVDRMPSGLIKIHRIDLLDYLKENNIYVDKEFFDITTIKIFTLSNDESLLDLINEVFKSVSLLGKFSSDYDLEISCSKDSITGLLKLGDLKPEILLIDLDLTKKNGIDICDRLKSDAVFKSTKIVAFTSDYRKYKNDLESDNIQYVLEKPFSENKFMDQIIPIIKSCIS